jgi:pimeloyl-ACP methyl ester carboxylesterase
MKISMGLLHPLDLGVAALLRRERLFTHGWGDEALLGELEGRALFAEPVQPITMSWTTAPGERRDGTFVSPSSGLPEACLLAHVRLLSRPGNVSACAVLAGSREAGFSMRESIYGPLVERGIDILLLENPFYGLRRPPEQRGANVRTVSEHAQLNLAMVEEGRALVNWLYSRGYARVGVAGYSMGGYMAALVAATVQREVAVTVMAAGASPAPVFTSRVLSWSIDFRALGDDRARVDRIFEIANVTRYPVPRAPQAAIIVGASADAYVPAGETRALHAHWKGSELRWVRSGHISALFTQRRALRAAVCDALARLEPMPDSAVA